MGTNNKTKEMLRKYTLQNAFFVEVKKKRQMQFLAKGHRKTIFVVGKESINKADVSCYSQYFSVLRLRTLGMSSRAMLYVISSIDYVILSVALAKSKNLKLCLLSKDKINQFLYKQSLRFLDKLEMT